ncbi:MAG: TetR/AcrR family transcriptional regulator [Spirochaetaceae bacterium]|nr:MAG: TetR/AcrR family transcriptional regulator [Spirochaetaceae bacterium]
MPPKVRFTREQIVAAALEIARTEGLVGITIRKIAAALGCSIAPIYVNFSHIDEVRRAVADRVMDTGRRFYADADTGSSLQDIGVASVRLAREYPAIFRDLVLSSNDYVAAQNETLDPELVAHMKGDPELAGLREDELQTLLLKMRVFHAGLATAVVNGILPRNTEDDEIIRLMNQTAGDLVTAAQLRAANRNSDDEDGGSE